MRKYSVSKQIRYFVAITLFYCSCQVLSAQNLVKNPSFEDFVQCPDAYGTFNDDVLFWTMPTYGSTDYFNNCSMTMGTTRNFTGKQDTFHGNAYAGLYAYGSKDYREYISGELKQKLEKNKKYIITGGFPIILGL